VRAHVENLGPADLTVAVFAPDDVPDLPAPVEEAAYRICLEAVTNVLRHARASHCEVQIRCGAAVELEIRDDGVGIPEQRRHGVGLLSMRSRAEAVGGCLSVTLRSGGGTVVSAVLPVETRVNA
jgi:signal transduction histidine kinase